MKAQLIFVYNANSDLFSAVTDFAHKIISPSTYDCHLCVLTYGSLTIKQEWGSFIETLPVETIFLHKDEFQKQHPIKTNYPAVYLVTNGKIKEIISKQEINSRTSLEQLKNLVTEKLKVHVQHHHSYIQ